MPSTIKDCQNEAKKHGCDLDVDRSGGSVELALFSPKGKVFAGTMCHLECGLHGHGFRAGFKPDWSQTLTDIQRVIAEGFEDCDDPDCEMCRPDDEE